MVDSLGSACRSRGLFKEARSLLAEALLIRRELLGEDNKEVAASLHNLGWLAQDEGRFPEAKELYCRALAMRRKWLGNEHPLVTATMFNLAWVTAHQFDAASPERLTKAEALLRDILERQQQWPTGEHGDPVLTRVALALVIYGSGSAERKDEAYTILLGTLGLLPQHPRSRPLLEAAEKYIRSQKHQEKRQFAQAIQLRREVLAILREQVGSEHFIVAALLVDIASVLAKCDRFDDARIEFQAGMRIAKKHFPCGHWLIARTITEAGEMCASAGRHGDAEGHFREAMEMAKAVRNPDLWQRARDGRVNSLKSLGRDSEAETLRKLQPPNKP
jgi:tetratricopeptide (TPR) repeat protein